MATINVSEQDHDCIFTITMASGEPVTATILNEDDEDITQDKDGNPGPVTMDNNGDGTFTGIAKICGVRSGETITILVCLVANPTQCETKFITLDHDCPACEEAAMMEMAAVPQVSAPPSPTPAVKKSKPKPKAMPKAKATPKAKAKAKAKGKAKPKAAKPATKPKKAKAKVKAKPKAPAKAKKAKPAKKKPAAKKKRR